MEGFWITLNLLLCLLFPSVKSQGTEGYFEAEGYALLSNVIYLEGRTSFSFRSCSSGELLYQTGLSGDFLTIQLLNNGAVQLKWRVGQTTDSVLLSSNTLDNKWHDVDLMKNQDSLTFHVDQNDVVVANKTFRNYIFSINLVGNEPSLYVGRNYTGCILQGPGVVLSNPSIQSISVNWEGCSLPATETCEGYGVNQCFSQPCQNHGICIYRENVSHFKCLCTRRYAGLSCEVDLGSLCEDATAIQCLNGGECQEDETKNSTYCACQPQFFGQFCESRVENSVCEGVICQNGGTCKVNELSNGYVCSCPKGFGGETCHLNIDECQSAPCQHNGTCTDGINSYTCDCQGTGYQGQNCEVNINECEELISCSGGGTCFDRYGSYICVCPPLSHSIAGSNGYFCVCDDGYAGAPPVCQKVNYCLSLPCQYGGTCIVQEDSFVCECLEGYEGPTCSDIACPECSIRSNTYATNPCGNGTCLEGQDSFTCVCPLGLTGRFCEQDIDECASSPCHQGICQNVPGSYKCYCVPGHTGKNCHIEINECLSNPCQNNGTCENQVNDYRCRCIKGFSGYNCEINVDECASDPCQNGGFCLDEIGAYNCECLPGYSGKNCEVNIDECASSPCHNNGTCNDMINGYECDCTDTGFEGSNCELNINDCLSSPCQHGGQCEDLVKDTLCHCYSGFEGKNCEKDIPECLASPCNNNGECLEKSNMSLYENNFMNLFPFFSYETAGGYLCVCNPGFTGTNCEVNIDDCASHSCVNGTCLDGVNMYTCLCFPGFSGKYCEIENNECDSNPCSIGSTCVDKINDYTCHCLGGFGGKNCDIALIGCNGNQCSNGATCLPKLVNGLHEYDCLCPTGFHGKLCNVITTASFRGTQRWELPRNNYSDVFQLELQFRTTLPDGVIVSFNNGNLTIFLFGGRIQLIKNTSQNLVSFVEGSFNSGNQWEQLLLVIMRENVSLTISGKVLFQTLTETMEVITSISLGGLPDPSSQPNFTGCVQDVKVDNELKLPDETLIEVGCPRKEQCESNPCFNGGVCKDRWFSHSCECVRPFFGFNCEKNITPTTFGYKDKISWAFLEFSEQEQREMKTSSSISLFIRTRKPEGLIFYLGSKPNYSLQYSTETLHSETYLAAILDKGQLRVLGAFPQEIQLEVPISLDDGYHHFIEVIWDGIRLTTRINSSVNVSDSLSQTTVNYGLDAEIIYLGSLPNTTVREKRQISDHLYGKKITSEIFSEVTNFKGVIQDARINGKLILFYPQEALEETNSVILRAPQLHDLKEGVISDGPCIDRPCSNNGTCKDIWNDFVCECQYPFRGKMCENVSHCHNNPCPDNSAICNDLDGGYECITEAAFNGSSGIKYKWNISENNLNDTITLRFRSINDSALLHIQTKDQLMLYLENGKVYITYNNVTSDILVSPTTVTDGAWHDLNVTFTEHNTSVSLDFSTQTVENIKNISLWSILNDGGHVYLGQSPEKSSFRGCMGEVRIGTVLLPFFTPEQLTNNSSPNQFLMDNGTDIEIGCVLCWDQDCHNNGSCEDRNNTYRCNCRYGYSGAWCQTIVDFCKPDPCQNKGLCTSREGKGYSCNCTDYYKGYNCSDQKTCDDSPCNNGGTCSDMDTLDERFECHCMEGFTGITCSSKINYCEDKPCIQGVCELHDEKQYICNCNDGFKGRNCSVRKVCLLDIPCENGGNCTELDDETENYTCTCTEEYLGPNCTILNLCYANRKICKNGGICVPKFHSPLTKHSNISCNCSDGFEGAFCEIERKSSPNNLVLVIVITVVTIVVLSLLIAVTAFLRMVRKKRATRGTYSPSRQEMCGSRVEMNQVMKPPPEERLI
ncbi:cell polarity complex component crumbs [Tachypleus tridentatus]|uniref:cell polarity complex component crumbs n=1 Tax=Tachypleus tridentatus TaxID=6853 RepID=UPI003FD67287